jgi:hypothetical protein
MSQLEVVFYQADGTIHRYYQDDPAQITHIVQQLHPTKAFSQKQIVLAGTHFAACFNTDSITRIDLVGPDVPHYPHLGSIISVKEVSERELDARNRPRLSNPRRSETMVHTGDRVETVVELGLTDGQRLGLRIMAEAAGKLDQRQLFQRFSTTTTLHADRLQGGVMILHMATATRFILYPGPPEIPSNALHLHRMELFRDTGPTLELRKADLDPE